MRKKTNMSTSKLNYFILFSFLMLSGCRVDPIGQVRAYEQAHNAHDVNKVMSMVAGDIRFEIAGSWMKSGKEQVHGLAEWDSVTHSHMIISDIEQQGDTVKFRLKEGNDWFRLIGIEYMSYDPCRIVFQNGLIKEIRAEVAQTSRDEFRKAWPPVLQWLSQNRSRELEELTPGGEFIYNSGSAGKWISLLSEWREKTRQAK